MERVQVGDAFLHACTFDEAVAVLIEHACSNNAPSYVVTPNAQHIVLLRADPDLREIYSKAILVVADGSSISLAARMNGRKLPGRIPGVDLFQRLCMEAAGRGLRVLLLGGKPGSAEEAASKLTERFPELLISTYCPPFGFERSDEELDRVAEAVRAAQPHLLFAAFGAPKQEHWMYESGRKLGVPVCVGVGGAFEMVAGRVRRAPDWVQRIGCEWVHRLIMEPRRMWKRYLIGNCQFAHIVIGQILSGSKQKL
jgi:N-acetylglucosaminyldiphosphoundecaprenol N-acetyl-beta-D-mannosaminyltransferase